MIDKVLHKEGGGGSGSRLRGEAEAPSSDVGSRLMTGRRKRNSNPRIPTHAWCHCACARGDGCQRCRQRSPPLPAPLPHLRRRRKSDRDEIERRTIGATHLHISPIFSTSNRDEVQLPVSQVLRSLNLWSQYQGEYWAGGCEDLGWRRKEVPQDGLW